MTRSVILLSIVFFFSMGAWAQCTQTVPSDAEIINTTVVSNQGGDIFWVCAEGNLEFNGGLACVFVEESGVVTVNGNVNKIVLNTGASANVNGNQDTAFVSAGASLNIDGNLNVVYQEPGSTTIINGIGNEIHDCTDIVIDYTVAPVGGCLVTATHETSIYGLTVSPNPASDFLNIQVDTFDIEYVALINSSGTRVVRLDTRDLPHVYLPLHNIVAGNYVLIASDKRNNSIVKKITIIR